jgi:hypothetical protein
MIPENVLTHERETELMARYAVTKDEDCIGDLIVASELCIMRSIRSLKPPRWIDHEEVYADIMPGIVVAVRKFDPSVCRLSTYLYKLARRLASRSISRMLSSSIETTECSEVVDRGADGSPVDVVDTVRMLFDMIPDARISEEGRKLVDRILRGSTITDISQQMGWGRDYTAIVVSEMRDEIAWRLMKNGSSAEPWIPDCQLSVMASRHEGRLDRWFWGAD